MILSDIKKHIDDNFRTESLLSAQRYCQGYIDGLKKYCVINYRDWHDLNNYVSERFKEKLNIQVIKIKKSWCKGDGNCRGKGVSR